ncbi:methyltransferase [Actinomadura sp. NBRC 104412]|uniref:class I SAM-dependent methyltransferase n=1 Tax=Actinomadura sp. NBRC 104412 TaxID=3032203 RepID=UPI0024A561AC|nr:class I SAM-dependent methyltransferase [Actinomadura sp. NBRC 104412]GLZ03342.1 methyltransferase [Actinomadura sp. NBRC 104412]
MTGGRAERTPERFWDEFYGRSERVWSGRPNPTLVREAAHLEPGTALDVGCGEGADAIWLAGRGWRVTGVDISAVALRRAAGHAAEAGVGDRVAWRRHDLSRSFPPGSFDLVTVHFLHSPADLPVGRVLRSAAAAVAPGGTLLVAGHAAFIAWDSGQDGEQDGGRDGDGGHHHEVSFPTPEEMLRSFELEEGRWRVEVNETVHHETTTPDGRHGTRADHVLRLRRLAA